MDARAERLAGGVNLVSEAVFAREESGRQPAHDETEPGKKCAISVQQQTAAELTALAKVVANWMILTPEARVRIEQIADRCVADSHEGS